MKGTILYEDQQGPLGRHYELHRFLLRGVADDLAGTSYFELEKVVEGRPLKGAGNVLRAIREDAERIGIDGKPILAIFDSDKVHRLVSLPAGSPESLVIEKLKEGCSVPGQVHVRLLVENVESILRAILECDEQADAELVSRAISQKDHVARDLALKGSAFEPAGLFVTASDSGCHRSAPCAPSCPRESPRS